MTARTEEYWERRKLEDERQTARRRGTNPQHPLGYARRVKAADQPCRVCALQDKLTLHSIEAHHIVHRSRLGGKHPLINHPDNILPVCHHHHQDHHTTTRRIPWEALTSDEQAFLTRHGGPSWSERWYPRPTDDNDDNRSP